MLYILPNLEFKLFLSFSSPFISNNRKRRKCCQQRLNSTEIGGSKSAIFMSYAGCYTVREPERERLLVVSLYNDK